MAYLSIPPWPEPCGGGLLHPGEVRVAEHLPVPRSRRLPFYPTPGLWLDPPSQKLRPTSLNSEGAPLRAAHGTG